MSGRLAAIRVSWLLAVVFWATCAALAADTSLPGPDSTRTASPGNIVVMRTSLGTIAMELFPEKAPLTVANFLSYVDSQFYAGLTFHRVIPNFMIQGGGLTPDMKEKKGRDPIKNESANGLSNLRGTVAMARRAEPTSATSQFFINVVDNKQLDKLGGGYCVFGKVIRGMDVVDKIKAVQTGPNGGHQDVPVRPIIILSVRRAGQ
jgi:cyclophilin family peptidyl-prolyl cis-trans isomerase